MTPAELHTDLVNKSPVLPGGQPYGVTAFGGDIMDNDLTRRTARTMRHHLGGAKQLRTIEVGSGGGRWTRHLANMSELIMAIDPARKMPEHLNALDLPCRVMPYVTKHWSLPTSLGSPLHESFDLAFSFDTYVHAAANEIAASISALANALKPEGLMVVHYATLDRKQPHQPHDESGCWITHWPYWINTALQANSIDLLETIYADEGYGSAVAFGRKRAD